MDQDQIVQNAVSYIRMLFDGNSDGHDLDHSLRVYRTAMQIADTEPACSRAVVALAALLHDADDAKLFSTEHFAHARSFLAAEGIDPETAEEVCLAISSVSFSKNRGKRPETLEAMIVQDADRLDALGAVGIARTFAFGGRHNRSLNSSVQHFYDKLLLLKDMMNTRKAKEMAEARHAFLEFFLREWKTETGE